MLAIGRFLERRLMMTFCGGVIVVERQESGNTPVPLGSWNKLMKTVGDRQDLRAISV